MDNAFYFNHLKVCFQVFFFCSDSEVLKKRFYTLNRNESFGNKLLTFPEVLSFSSSFKPPYFTELLFRLWPVSLPDDNSQKLEWTLFFLWDAKCAVHFNKSTHRLLSKKKIRENSLEIQMCLYLTEAVQYCMMAWMGKKYSNFCNLACIQPFKLLF